VFEAAVAEEDEGWGDGQGEEQGPEREQNRVCLENRGLIDLDSINAKSAKPVLGTERTGKEVRADY
jgi:hypothetical protein